MAKEHGLIHLVMNGLLLKQILVIKNGLKKQTTQDMFESLEKTKPSGEHDEELLDIPRFLRRQDPDLDF